MRHLSKSKNAKSIYRLSLLMIIIGVLLSYFLSGIHLHESRKVAGNLGWLTVLQFAYLTSFMFLAWWSAPSFNDIKHLRLLLFVAVLVRLILIPIDSYTSNDVDRYLFDGKIALSGLDPYQVNHNDPQLQELKQQWSPPEEHAKYPTLYPPLSLGLFTLASIAGPDHAELVWKLVVTLSGILTVFVLVLLLKKIQRLQHLPLIAFSPLLILETGVGAHVDSITALMVSLAIYAFYANRLVFSGVFIGLGALTKILPIMLLIPLFFGVNSGLQRVQLAIACGLTVLSAYLITLAAGLIPIGSIGTLFDKWRFGSPLFRFFESFTDSKLILLIPLVLIFTGCIFLIYRAVKLDKAIEVSHPLLPWSMGIILLVSPVVFPWYLMSLIPLLVLSPRPFFLTWVCLLPLTYEVLGGFSGAGVWAPATWPLVVIFAGFMVSFYVEKYKNKS